MEDPKKTDEVEILIVEDNPSDVELTLRALKKHNFVNNVSVVKDGEEALEFIFCTGRYASRDIAAPVKVILLDLGLPKVPGLEVLKQIKADPRTKSIPVVIVTSSLKDVDLRESYKFGANSVIVKPIDFESFVRSIGEAGFYWLLLNQSPR
ncbi:MAG: response regulator [Patescibacteria group bacterium]